MSQTVHPSMIRLLLLFTYNIMLSVDIQAQAMYIHPLSIDQRDSLTSGYNDYIKTDSKDITWISSNSGIFRYDARGIKRYLSNNENIQSSFYEDQHSNLWCSSYTKLFRYDRLRDTFESFQIRHNQDSVIDLNYRVFHLEQDSIVWLRAGDHIYRFNAHTHKATKVIASKAVSFGVTSDVEGKVRKIYACAWHNDNALEVIDYQDENTVKKTRLFQPLMLEQELEFFNLSIQNDSLVWIFSNKGLFAFYPKRNNTLEKITLRGFTNPSISAGTPVDSNFLLLHLANSSLWLFDTHQKKLVRPIQAKGDDISNINLKNTRALYLDPKNRLWMSHGNGGGISMAWFYHYPFHLPFQKRNTADIPSILSIVEDKQKQLWCNTQDGHIFSINQKNRITRSFDGISTDSTTLGKSRRLSQDEAGNIWALVKNKLYRFHKNTSSWQEEFSGKSEQLFFLLHLSNQRKLVATMNGIIEIQKLDGKWRIMPQEESGQKYLTQGLQLFKGKSGQIYISSKSHALKIFTEKEGRLKRSQQLDFSAEIYSIWEDDTLARTWLGTSSGVYYFDWKSKAIFKGPAALQNMVISGIIKDIRGRLWVTSTVGLFCKEEDHIYRYLPENGLPSSAFSLYASQYSSDGKICLGTSKGIVTFHPDSIQAYPYPPSLIFENIKINNEIPSFDIDLNKRKSVKLAYDQHTLSFDLKAFTHHLPHLNTIHYRLVKHDSVWHSTLHKGHLRFAQLKPGDYLFEVYPVNANGVKGEIRKIAIQISPPWWTSWWAISLFLFLFIASIYSGYLFLLNRKLKEQKRLLQQQQMLQAERNRIAGELHDDLGAGLSIIRFLSTPKKQQSLAVPDPKKINRIYQSAGDLMEKMGDIIWAMNTENDHLENLSDYLEQYIYEYLGYHELACEVIRPETFEEIALSGKQRRNILLIIKESLHNIVKHAKASKVTFSLSIEGKTLLIQVIDDGRGFEQNTSSNFGNGLKNIRKRIQEIGGQVNFKTDDGTKVIVKIPIE